MTPGWRRSCKASILNIKRVPLSIRRESAVPYVSIAEMSVRCEKYPELEALYELHETLGAGGFAKVKEGVHRLTGEKVAIKIMDKVMLGHDLPRVYREIRALKKLHHQHICQMFQVIETEKTICIVLEHCPGGEVFDYIVSKERLNESEARSFFRQILASVHYAHQMGFIHRDLKPENMLLDGNSNIKLIDFGLVAEPESLMDLLQTCCGSPSYAAPELIKGGPYIGTKADVWSLGVLLYALLNGFLPFDHDQVPVLYKLIQKGKYEIPNWLSHESIEILAQMLQTDPHLRISTEELLQHPWVVKEHDIPVDSKSRIELDTLDLDCIMKMIQYHGATFDEMVNRILQWDYDHISATYLLLLQQKLHGKLPTILMPRKTEPPPKPPRQKRPSIGQPMHPPKGEIQALPLPYLDAIKAEARVEQPHSAGTPQPQRDSTERPVVKAQSYDSRLNKAGESAIAPVSPQRRGRFGSIDSLFQKVKSLRKSSDEPGPKTVKALFDCSTTSTHSIDDVIQELSHTLTQMGIPYTKKSPYIFKCQALVESGDSKKKVVKFDLEVCLLTAVDMIGIRRKRRKGDVWEFKRICNKIFKMTNL
eukprot:Em0010g722a